MKGVSFMNLFDILGKMAEKASQFNNAQTSRQNNSSSRRNAGNRSSNTNEERRRLEILIKKYEGVARHHEERAKREYAYYKNAKENGLSQEEAQRYYVMSQDDYRKAQEARENAERARRELASIS